MLRISAGRSFRVRGLVGLRHVLWIHNMSYSATHQPDEGEFRSLTLLVQTARSFAETYASCTCACDCAVGNV